MQSYKGLMEFSSIVLTQDQYKKLSEKETTSEIVRDGGVIGNRLYFMTLLILIASIVIANATLGRVALGARIAASASVCVLVFTDVSLVRYGVPLPLKVVIALALVSLLWYT
tara:strand:+ start:873 stop:1208 length:336 start_codon:yes stop_codon:yes gene_type:complete